MKEKILLAIKAKFPAVNLSKKRLDEISAKIEKKCGTDETLIDTKVDDYNEYYSFADIAKEDDIVRDLKTKVKSATPPKKEEDTPAADDTPDDTPKWARDMAANQKKITDELNQLRAEKLHGSIKSEAAKLLKDVPEKYWGKRNLPSKKEDIEAFVAEVTNDYAEFNQELKNNGLADTPIPKFGFQSSAATGKVDADIVKFAQKQTEQVTQKN